MLKRNVIVQESFNRRFRPSSGYPLERWTDKLIAIGTCAIPLNFIFEGSLTVLSSFLSLNNYVPYGDEILRSYPKHQGACLFVLLCSNDRRRWHFAFSVQIKQKRCQASEDHGQYNSNGHSCQEVWATKENPTSYVMRKVR